MNAKLPTSEVLLALPGVKEAIDAAVEARLAADDEAARVERCQALDAIAEADAAAAALETSLADARTAEREAHSAWVSARGRVGALERNVNEHRNRGNGIRKRLWSALGGTDTATAAMRLKSIVETETARVANLVSVTAPRRTMTGLPGPSARPDLLPKVEPAKLYLRKAEAALAEVVELETARIPPRAIKARIAALYADLELKA